MSVSDPVDSGGGMLLSQGLQEGFEKLNELGGWAEMMAEVSSFAPEEPEEVSTPRGSRRPIPEEGPFHAQVKNLPSASNPEDVFFFFGGEDMVEEIEPNMAQGQAILKFFTKNGLLSALAKDKQLFDGREIRVFLDMKYGDKSRESSDVRKISSDVRQQRGYHDTHREKDVLYNRQDSQYTSRSSIHSNASNSGSFRRPHEQGYNYNRGPPSYPGRPSYRERDGGYGHRDRGGYGGGRGGYGYGGPSGRGGRQPYFDNRNRPGDLQRSGSYSDRQYSDMPAPAPIARSQTESNYQDRRYTDMSSRTSSRLSVNTEDERPVIKKPSVKDIFGEAKPVDSNKRLQEIEERQERERQELKRAEAEAKAAKQQQQPQHRPPHQQYHHGHVHPQHHHHHQQMQPAYPSPPTHAVYIQPQYSPGFVTPQIPMTTGIPPQFTTPGHNNSQPKREEPVHGSVTIMQRGQSQTMAARDTSPNASPPLDPRHSTPASRTHETPKFEEQTPAATQEPTAPIAKGDTKSRENLHSSSQPPEVSADGKKREIVRTFVRTNKPYQTQDNLRGNMSHRGSRGGTRGSRGGGGRGATISQQDRRNSTSSQKTGEDSHGRSDDEKKDRSHQSLRGRGAHRKGENRGGFKDRPPREHRPERQHKDNLSSKESLHKEKVVKQTSAPKPEDTSENKAKMDQPSEPVRRDSASKPPPVPVQFNEQTAPDTPKATNEEGNQKKKNKKNNKKGQSTTSQGFSTNKYAALMNASE